MIDTDQILADAEVAALYFRSLIDKGVPATHAVYMTTSYISSRQIARMGNEPPKEPWQDKS